MSVLEKFEIKRSFLAGDAGMDHEQNFCPGGTFWGKGSGTCECDAHGKCRSGQGQCGAKNALVRAIFMQTR